MPVQTTYPGVYIEEIPSGVRTITGVATSIAAFIGWAPKGPTDRAVRVLSWADYERQFGGLDSRSILGSSVNQFFANGGTQAYIVRLADSATAKTAQVTLSGILQLTATSAGAWANAYCIQIKNRTDASNPIDTARFRLTVAEVKPDGTEVPVESYENLSMTKGDPRFVEASVNGVSAIITAKSLAAGPPPPADTAAPSPLLKADTAGDDGTVLVPSTGSFETALDVGGTAGVHLLDRVDLFNLLCVPGETTGTVLGSLETYCRAHRAFLIADSGQSDTVTTVQTVLANITGDDAINAAFYYPWIKAPNPLKQNAIDEFPPCGYVAGLYAKTDANRGVWKAPAGTEASLSGVVGAKAVLTEAENGVLNPLAVNCIRTFPVYGTVIWGARTLRGNDEVGSEWKYIPIRRLALFLEETLYRNTQWVVFEPNDEPLWAQIRLNVGSFMHDLFRQGAFQGKTPQEAYFVKCDGETTTQSDRDHGIVNILVGFAPLKPAEFVVIKIQQIAGQIAT